MLRSLELSPESHGILAARCRELGIAFMSTAFDLESLRLLAGFDVQLVDLAPRQVGHAGVDVLPVAAGVVDDDDLVAGAGRRVMQRLEAALQVFGDQGFAAIREDIMSRQSLISTMISGWRMFKD